ncbi:MAG: DUF1566 domain-containing protein, partial [Desulfobulbaceae bacterium]|nr:DUF1566 domain-containing protein [Desulfobulbaceae bacterium]
YATEDIAQDSRFVRQSNGTVVDTKTGLMWAAGDNGEDVNWSTAALFCEQYAGGGYTDWRLPTSEELSTLYTPEKVNKDGLFISELIRLSSIMMWTADRHACKAKTLDFTSGLLLTIVGSRADVSRVLPVRGVAKKNVK